jgi:hypothetical protein
MFLGSKVRPVRGADKPVSGLSRQCGSLNIPRPYRPPRPLTGIAFLLYCSKQDGPAGRRPLSVWKRLAQKVQNVACRLSPVT